MEFSLIISVVAPSIIAGLCLLIVILFFVKFIHKKYCQNRAPNDCEALTPNDFVDNDSEEAGEGTLTVVQVHRGPGSCSSSSLSESTEEPATFVNNRNAFVSVHVQTDPVPWYTPGPAGATFFLEGRTTDKSDDGTRTCYSEPTLTGRSSNDNDSVGERYASYPLLHFDGFTPFANFVTGNQQPLTGNLSLTPTSTSEDIQENSRNEQTPHRSVTPVFTSETEQTLIRERREAIEQITKGHTEISPLIVTDLDQKLILIQNLRYFISDEANPLPVENIPFSHVKSGLAFLQELQNTEQNPENLITAAQNLILLEICREIPTAAGLSSALIIGVDATPNFFGGYCVNLIEKKIQFYAIRERDNPWKTKNKNNPSEFEMKNCLLALSIWNKEITKYKTFSVFTDNNAVSCPQNRQGHLVLTLLKHFTDCTESILVNKENFYVNRRKDLEAFAKYIQPADDLSRREISHCTEFLCKLYSIEVENVTGTHKEIEAHLAPNEAPKSHHRQYEMTPFYDEALEEARKFIEVVESCPTCSSGREQLFSSIRNNQFLTPKISPQKKAYRQDQQHKRRSKIVGSRFTKRSSSSGIKVSETGSTSRQVQVSA